MDVYVGCSGFFYREWKGVFYPESLKTSQWLKYYSKYFNTVEINSTFYHFPEVSNLLRLYRQVPEDFLFSVKVNRKITHLRRFEKVEDEVSSFYKTVEKGLKEKIACFLFQLPPSYRYSQKNLEKILKALDKQFCNVVEFRDRSWWREEVFLSFKKERIVFCSISAPELPEDLIKTTDTLYIRFHGKKQWYRDLYTEEELIKYRNKILQIDPEKIFAYFNNTYKGYAVQNAKFLKEILNK